MKLSRKTLTNCIESIWFLFAVGLILCCSLLSFQTTNKADAVKIVSVNGTVSEILCALGLESNIVGVDVTSTYPGTLDKLPKVGHNRNISAEGVVSLNPSLVVGTTNEMKAQLVEQLNSAGVKSTSYIQDFSVEGTKKLIKAVASTFHLEFKGETLIKQLDADLAKVKKPANKKKVLFIYARGAGTLMVAGKGTQVQKMIELAGGINAVNDFDDFKPLNSESLVAANPDIILMFDSGLQSMEGIDGLLKVQGIASTNAGKNKRVITMDGQYLAGFGPRLGKALAELSSKIQ